MKQIINRIIVWSIDDFNTLGLMRELGSSGLDLVFLIQGKAGFAAKSKYCKEFVETESIEDGHEYIRSAFGDAKTKPILIISSDEIITYVDMHKSEFDELCIAPGSLVAGNIEKYIDKNRMTELAEKIGIRCPQSSYFDKNASLDQINFPCFVKPSHQKPGHYNEFKTKLFKSKKQLARAKKFFHEESEFILQQYIPQEENALIYGARMRDGRVVLAGAFVRDRWADSGSSSHGYITDEIPGSIDVKLLCELVERIGYFGPFSAEYGIAGGQAFFFEINLRNDGTSHYFFQAGANIPLAYVASCAGLDYSAIQTKVDRKSYFIDELFDYENVILGRVAKHEWQRDFSTATVYKYYDSVDVEPFLLAKKGRTRQIVQDLVLKRFRLYIVFVMDKIGMGK